MNAFIRHLRVTYETLEFANLSAAMALTLASLGVLLRILETRGTIRRGWCDQFLLWSVYFAAAACGLILLTFIRANQAVSIFVAGGRRA